MQAILMAVGDDRPGLTRSLADAIGEADGNWLESHFAHLGSKFVGSVLVELPEAGIGRLEQAAAAMEADGFSVSVLASAEAVPPAGRLLTFEIVGRDRPGIVREVTAALAAHSVNIEELRSTIEDGAMFGSRLFRASVRAIVPEATSLEIVRKALEDISGEIMVDIES